MSSISRACTIISHCFHCIYTHAGQSELVPELEADLLRASQVDCRGSVEFLEWFTHAHALTWSTRILCLQCAIDDNDCNACLLPGGAATVGVAAGREETASDSDQGGLIGVNFYYHRTEANQNERCET